jgi:Domain of unknown function (DUF6316)
MEFAGIPLARLNFGTANYTRFDLRRGSHALQALYSGVQRAPNVAQGFWSNAPQASRNPIMRRSEDREDKTYFRSERVFAMNGQWYFGAREGDCGPFRTQEIARAALARFINEKVELASFQKSREHEVRRPKMTLAERLKIADVVAAPSRTLDATSELLI